MRLKPLLFTFLLLCLTFHSIAQSVYQHQFKSGIGYANTNPWSGYHLFIEYNYKIHKLITVAPSMHWIDTWQYMNRSVLEANGLVQETPSQIKGRAFELNSYFNVLQSSKHLIRIGGGGSLQTFDRLVYRLITIGNQPQIDHYKGNLLRFSFDVLFEYEYLITDSWSVSFRGVYNSGYFRGAYITGINAGYAF